MDKVQNTNIIDAMFNLAKAIRLSEYAVMQKGIPDNERLLYLRNTTEYRAYMVILPPSAAINGRGDIYEVQLDAYHGGRLKTKPCQKCEGVVARLCSC